MKQRKKEKMEKMKEREDNPRSQARSLAQLQDIRQFDFGQDTSSVTDRLVVFERLVADYERSGGEQLGVEVKCAVPLERVPQELRTHLLLTCGSRPDCAVMRQTVESYSVARRSWQPSYSTSTGEAPMEVDVVSGGKKARTKEKESTKVNKSAVLSLRAHAFTAESGVTSSKTVDTRTLWQKLMRMSPLSLHAGASSSTSRVTPPPPGLSSTGIAQSTTGMISTLTEGHAQSGWLCKLETGVEDTKLCDDEMIELLVDTAATEHVCGPQVFTHVLR